MDQSHDKQIDWPVWVFTTIVIIALVFVFWLGGHWGTVGGLVWVCSGMAAFLIVLMTPFQGDSGGETLDQGISGLGLGPIGLVAAALRVRDYRSRRNYATR